MKPAKSVYKSGLRHKIIDDGISFINTIANNVEIVKSFGDDIIQFFYDISVSSSALDRQKPLKFAESMSHNYVEILNRLVYLLNDLYKFPFIQGWYSDTEPSGEEILQIICGMYSMDRTGIFSRLRYDLRNLLKEKYKYVIVINY